MYHFFSMNKSTSTSISRRPPRVWPLRCRCVAQLQQRRGLLLHSACGKLLPLHHHWFEKPCAGHPTHEYGIIAYAHTAHMLPFALFVVLFARAHVGSCHDEFGVPTYPSSVPAFDQLSAPVGPPVFIHGGVIVNADGQVAADVLLENGIIVAVGSNLRPPQNAINIDASGKYVLAHALLKSRV
jgi:hypothetical protein